MNDLVKIKNGNVVTNSRDIFDDTGKDHANVTKGIEKLIKKLTRKNKQVKDYFIKTTYTNSRNRTYKSYDMTRDGFVLLAMGYTKEKFMDFKLKYIDAFNSMEKELKRIHVTRSVGIETRKVLTDEVKESGENDRMHGHAYSTYTKLAYNLAGIEYKSIPNFRDTLSPEELSRVENIESMMKALIRSGKQYNAIKQDLINIFAPLLQIETKDKTC